MLYVTVISDENQTILMLDVHEIKFAKTEKGNPKIVNVTWKDGALTSIAFDDFNGAKKFVVDAMKTINGSSQERRCDSCDNTLRGKIFR